MLDRVHSRLDRQLNEEWIGMKQLAHRLDRLGTETAFSIAELAAWTSKGNPVRPFQLSDINIPIAPHMVEAMDRAAAPAPTK